MSGPKTDVLEAAYACARLRIGHDGPSQPRPVKAWLRRLEREELARFAGQGHGWRLTPKGQACAATVRCEECGDCQEWILTPDQAGPCLKVRLPKRSEVEE